MTDKLKKEGKRILLTVILYFAILILDKTGVVPFVFENTWLSFFVYLIPYFICGWDVVRKALLGIKNRKPFDESFLMFVATIGAFVTGENSEAVAVMAFYQVGEWFQDFAVGRSRKSITELMEIAPEYADVERADGTVERVDPDDVQIGDILIIRPGEKIPVDAIVRSGDSMIDTAALTGESVPRSVHAGDQVISGCINGEGLLRAEAVKAYEDSTVAKILEMVEESSDKKSRTEQFITRFARVYTPIVVYAALALAVIPSIITGDPATWVYRACTFLVISCPCALVISVPLAFFGGIGAASRNGVLVKGSNYLELMAGLDTVVSDKTGTLTEGSFRVSAVEPAPGVEKSEVLRMAALAESMSTHPIAASIRQALEEEQPDALRGVSALEDTDNVSGQGLIAVSQGRKIYVGNGRLMEACGIAFQPAEDPAATVVYVAVGNAEKFSSAAASGPEGTSVSVSTQSTPGDGAAPGDGVAQTDTTNSAEDSVDGKSAISAGAGIRYLGSISIRDSVKKEARQAITDMKACGVRKVVMLTGDRKTVGEAVGKELGVDEVYSELLPQDKVARVEQMLQELRTDENAQSGRSDTQMNRSENPEKTGASAQAKKSENSGNASKKSENDAVRHALAFVGDGINDAPVLMRSDVGIAMGSMGSAAAIEAADVVIMDDDLRRIPMVIRIARRTVGISTQNIVFALAVKLLILVLGALGLAGMWAAVFADVGVACLCILNSMRLLQKRDYLA